MQTNDACRHPFIVFMAYLGGLELPAMIRSVGSHPVTHVELVIVVVDAVLVVSPVVVERVVIEVVVVTK